MNLMEKIFALIQKGIRCPFFVDRNVSRSQSGAV